MESRRIADEISNMTHSERKDDDRIQPLNGDGSTRMAYRFLEGPLKDKVIKIAMMGTARKENEDEMQTWMKVKDTPDRDLFCPIRDIDRTSHKWLIMDYAEPINVAKGVIKTKIQSAKLKRAVEDSYDITLDNIGNHRQHGTVIFDYPWAYNKERYTR
jgi:hypothetical protein